MASKASGLFSHFLFISLSKKGWNNNRPRSQTTETKYIYICSKRTLIQCLSAFTMLEYYTYYISVQVNIMLVKRKQAKIRLWMEIAGEIPVYAQIVCQWAPSLTGWWSCPGKSRLFAMNPRFPVGRTACSVPQKIYATHRITFKNDFITHSVQVDNEWLMYLRGGQQLTRAMVLEI